MKEEGRKEWKNNHEVTFKKLLLDKLSFDTMTLKWNNNFQRLANNLCIQIDFISKTIHLRQTNDNDDYDNDAFTQTWDELENDGNQIRLKTKNSISFLSN